MFKWPGTPSARSPEHELADYAELVCWQNDTTSTSVLSADLGRLDENDYSNGVPEEEETPQLVDAAYQEIERRGEACGDGYPFVVGKHGYTLRAIGDHGNKKHAVYKCLLLATRLNMENNRDHAGIDGTCLFEELAAEVAQEYFGDRAESYLFRATAGGPDFSSRVDELCRRMKEGNRFHNHGGDSPRAVDGKLDVVVWKAFTDSLPGKLIAFGQCKTGTHYKDKLTQLQPDAFCDKWLLSKPAVSPVRMFLISEALSRSGWYDVVRDAGLLFDRCRIVDFCDHISSEVWRKVQTWTEAAAKAVDLST